MANEKVRIGFNGKFETKDVAIAPGDPAPWDPSQKFSILGTKVARLDGPAKVSGQARYPVQDGVANSTVFWIDVFRDELLWRVRAFRSAGDARTAHDTGEVASRSSG